MNRTSTAKHAPRVFDINDPDTWDLPMAGKSLIREIDHSDKPDGLCWSETTGMVRARITNLGG